jgi:hypothetical protein
MAGLSAPQVRPRLLNRTTRDDMGGRPWRRPTATCAAGNRDGLPSDELRDVLENDPVLRTDRDG